jgi:hypothetical protein
VSVAEQLAFDGPGRAITPAVVMTAHHGRNDAMIASVARLYIADGATVLDCTWGKGNFWTRTDTSRFRLIGTDLASPAAPVRADFRALPFADTSMDVVVFDPPYVHSVTQRRDISATYRNLETTPALTYAAIMDLYAAGMTEARRILRAGGTCWVKCQDTVENHGQRWSVVNVHAMGTALGFQPQDLFVLVAHNPPGGMSAERQYHARRNHSYLWIFAKRRGN